MYRVGLAGDSGEAWADLLLRTEVVWVNEGQESGLPYDIVLR
jgi:hypothetical protein